MKKVVYNIVYQPQIKLIHRDGEISKPQLGFFENERDAEMAISLLYNLERVISKELCVELAKERSVEEKQVPQGANVAIYTSLKEFAHKNDFVKYFTPKVGALALDRLVEDKVRTSNYMYGH